MRVLIVILAGAAALAATAAFGAETAATQPLTRAQVRQSALDAKAAGELHPGEDVRYPATPATPPGKPVHWKKRHRSAAARHAAQADGARP